MKLLTAALKESDGKASASRQFAFFFGGLIFACWLGVGAWMIWMNWGAEAGALLNVWEDAGVGSWMTWGRDALFVTVMPYIGNKIAGAFGKKTESGGG